MERNINSSIIFKSKGTINNSYNPVDIHPVQPWILYCDSENNIIIQNYQNNEKILNFSISQHDEDKREQMILQKRVPTLSTLSVTSPIPNGGNSPGSATINYQTTTTGNTGTTQSATGGINNLNSGGNQSGNSPNIPSIQIHNATQTLHKNSASNQNNLALKSSLNSDISNSSQISSDQFLDKIEKLGQIKFLYFYDRYTRSYKDRKPKLSQNKNNINKPITSVGIDDFIVVVAENRIVFINYHSQRLKEIKITAFENKAPSCVEFFSTLPYIAFGGPDSVTRLWNVEKWELERQLVGGHPKGSIVKLKAIELDSDILASVGTDGYCCLWNLKTGSLLNQFTKTGHEFVDLAYDHVSGYLLGLTDDRMLYTYDPNAQKEISKVSCGKKEYQSLETYYHPRLSGLDIMLTMKSPATISFFNRSSPAVGSSSSSSKSSQPEQSRIDLHIDIDNLLGTGKKEKSKLYKVFQHPLNPSLLICWINKSIYILSIYISATPIFATTLNSTTNEHTIYYPMSGHIYQSPLANILNSSERQQTPVQIPTGETLKLEISPSGKYLSLHSHQTSQYQIFDIASWKLLEKGVALDIAWSGKGSNKDSEKYGILEKVFESVDTIKKKKTLGILPTGKPSKKEEQVFSKILLKTKEITNNTTQELLINVNEDKIIGGFLLGIYHRNSDYNPLPTSPGTGTISSNNMGGPSSGNLSSSSGGSSSSNLNTSPTSSGPKLQNTSANTNNSDQETPINQNGEENEFVSFHFLDWWTLQPVGDLLPPPLKVYWDQSQTLCAILYSNHFSVFRLRPSFNLVCRFPYSATSALWHNNTLFIATQNEIQCIFPHKNESAPLILASSSGIVYPEDLYDPSSGSLSSGSKPNQTFSQFPNYRPTGSISLVQVNNEGLVILDSNSKFYCLPLSHYLLKFFMLAQMDSIESAMKCASMVDPKYHYLMAKFLTVRGQPKECLQLSGISNFLKFSICINNESYEASLDIVPLLTNAIKSHQIITNESTNEEITLSSLGKMCIEIGQKSQNKGDYPTAERAFKLASNLDPHSAFQELALHYVYQKKFNDLKSLQQSLQQNYPIESNLITLFLE